MLRKTSVPQMLVFQVFASMLILQSVSHAASILSEPSFTPAPLAPLAGVLRLTTDVDTRVSVSVADGTTTWQRDFYDFGTTHSLTLLGFKPGRTNAITITVHDRWRNAVTFSQPLYFNTDPLPVEFPTLTVLKSDPQKMEPGYTLFRGASFDSTLPYITIVDNSGQVVWYSGVPTTADVRQLGNGDLFIPLETNFVELNMLGETVKTWDAPVGLPIDLHDGFPTGNGTILYLSDASRTVTNYPSSVTDSNAPPQTASVQYERVVEFSVTNSQSFTTWSPIDVLDPTRIGYFGLLETALGYDSEHSNAVIEDPRDDSLIVSMRHQNAVVKFSRATGQLKWILGPHENWGPQWQPYLLTPVGSPFEWNYAQHAPTITPRGTLLLYDNGDFRASPFDEFIPDERNHSRAVEYSINENTMEVSQVWEYGSHTDERLYTPAVGSAQWLPQRGNVLIDFGIVSYVNGASPSPFSNRALMVRIKEVTYAADPEVVFDLALFDYANTNSNYIGNWAYRSYRIPDLYGHPAQPVGDLTIRLENARPLLEFSADEFRTYVIEASPNLTEWKRVGVAAPDSSGLFRFQDTDSDEFTARHYRILTQ